MLRYCCRHWAVEHDSVQKGADTLLHGLPLLCAITRSAIVDNGCAITQEALKARHKDGDASLDQMFAYKRSS